MSPSIVSTPPALHPRATLAKWSGWALAATGAALVWPGGMAALGGAGLMLAGAALALRQPPASAGTAPPEPDDPPSASHLASAAIHQAKGQAAAGRRGSEVMVASVVPVWARQLDVTREAAGQGLAGILEQFSQMSQSLSTLINDIESHTVTAEPGAVDQSVRRESSALQALLEPSRRAFAQRDAAVTELARCATALAELQHLAQQTTEIARHTRLVAFNASIEANRGERAPSPGAAAGAGSAANGGSQAVASELRHVATRMADIGEHIGSTVAQLVTSMRQATRDGTVNDTQDEELQLELDLKAREALSALLGGLGSALQGSQAVKDTSRALSEQLESTFMHFQFGDRISQMLSIVANDMGNFTKWVAQNPQATKGDADAWLAALEASYTMDEQRTTHHGNVHVEQSAGVEFF